MPTDGPAALRDILSRTERISDLRDLFRVLGYQPAWEPVPPGPWLGVNAAEAAKVGSAAIVARHSVFRVFGLEAADPAAAARAGATRLAGTTERGLVCALAPSAPAELWLATWRAGIRGTRPVRALGLAVRPPRGSTLALLERVVPQPSETALALSLRVGDALATEQVGTRFFRSFRGVLDAFTDAIPQPRSRRDRHALALTTLTRVLFLYFIQSKGWLNGERRYLAQRLSAVGSVRSFDRAILQPLCFGALNRPKGERSAATRALGAIPFLNGGLFEPTQLERRHGVPSWPNMVWRDSFDGLFERFHFSVREYESEDLVEPDMLGRVFEGVMDPAERSSSGTFYTPASLVREVVRAGLAAVLETRFALPAEAAQRWVYDGQRPFKPPDLRRLRVLDPAVGSGAFLLGALDELVRLRMLAGEADTPALRRDVLAHSLYGVDISPVAVRLTELRLWLALVVDCDNLAADQLAPLPNLDGHVRQGDALIDPLALARSLGAAPVAFRDRAERIGDVRRQLFDWAGPRKRAATARLAREEQALAGDLYRAAISLLEHSIRRLIREAQQPDLFGRRSGLDAAQRQQLRRQRQCRRELRSALRRIEREGGAPFFAFESHFADIVTPGFDLVLGNPPWVRGESLPARVREALAARYHTWRPAANRGYAHLPDLSVAFVERAMELSAPGGATALLVPAKLATSGYAERLRHALATTTRIVRAAPIDQRSAVGFGAVVYPMALVTASVAPGPDERTMASLGRPQAATGVAQATLSHGPWVLVPDVERVASRLRSAFPTIGERWTAQLGVKTGADSLFLVAERLPGTRPALRGRDVAAFHTSARVHLLWTHDPAGRPLRQLPETLAVRLMPHAERLSRRADYRSGPPWQLFRMGLACAPHRVVWPDLARTLAAAVPDADAVPLNTVYGIVAHSATEACALAAFLNARWLTCLARSVADPARGAFARFNARVVAQLPVPRASAPGWAALAALGARGETDNELVADLLELDASDRRALDRQAAG